MSVPLDHLLSVDLGESHPLLDVFKDEIKTAVKLKPKKLVKKVRFAETCYESTDDASFRDSGTIVHKPDANRIRGILKLIKTSKSNDMGRVKEWSKPSPSVPVTVNIVSHLDESCTDSEDTSESVHSETKMSRDSTEVSSANGINNDDKEISTELNSFIDEVNEVHQSTDHEKHLQYEGCDDQQTNKNEASTVNSSFNGLQNDDEQSNNKDVKYDDLSQEKKILVDEIRKMSNELFVETASHLDERDIDNDQDDDVSLPDRSFINTDLVNDILRKQGGNNMPSFLAVEDYQVTSRSSEREKVEESVGFGNNAPSTESSAKKSDSRVKRPSSPHLRKLRKVLEETVPENPTARDLRSIAFSAWCAIKAEEKKTSERKQRNSERSVHESMMKEKSLKEASAVKAFLCWKEQKEKIIKLRRENELKEKEVKISKVQQDKKKKKEDAALVFKAWKKKKDEELKVNLKKQKIKIRQENSSKGHSEDVKKLEAASAFNAWKSQKAGELQRKEKGYIVKKELETSQKEQERSERDKEAIKAYELWLEYKDLYESSYDWCSHLESRPPWSPPGRIA